MTQGRADLIARWTAIEAGVLSFDDERLGILAEKRLAGLTNSAVDGGVRDADAAVADGDATVADLARTNFDGGGALSSAGCDQRQRRETNDEQLLHANAHFMRGD